MIATLPPWRMARNDVQLSIEKTIDK